MAIKQTLAAAKQNDDESKSRLDSLLTYANGTTGKADVSIGDAIKTLCDGYGQGGNPPRLKTAELTKIDSHTLTIKVDTLPRFILIYPTTLPPYNGLVALWVGTGATANVFGGGRYVFRLNGNYDHYNSGSFTANYDSGIVTLNNVNGAQVLYNFDDLVCYYLTDND